ncbi:acetyltransferase [Galdieria sulphuraria]|uniref:Acetyltransferase n=1 Tax=Galdieria sulphuraria TaxID=130081 RepID=M2XRU4_GALSU|nr:acetyltransferase [Galdieria sulphuraria]EME26368.1 acetyltransferase [Galdieria sulphuraria]|eukprot:XP_005702888.1 acetyltransferase [Galdieria sulphuraria]
MTFMMKACAFGVNVLVDESCLYHLSYRYGNKHNCFQVKRRICEKQRRAYGVFASVSEQQSNLSLLTYHIRPLQRHEIFQFTHICNECFHAVPRWKLLLRPLFFVETFLGLLLLLNRKEAEKCVEEDEVLVAQDETTGNLVGVVQLSTIPQGSQVFQAFSRVQKGKIPYVYNLAVLPQVRRRGIGRGLLQKCEEIVRERWKYNKVGLHSIVVIHFG